MCGIFGVLERNESLVNKALDIMADRGIDGKSIIATDNITIGHRLHAIVNCIKQPFEDDAIFAANCEIYNWEELNNTLQLNARNDSEVIFKLLKHFDVEEVVNLLDGVYAFCYYKHGRLVLVRDIYGVKPLFYDRNKLAFSSEKKALIGFDAIEELNPRKILIHENNETRFIDRKFTSHLPEHTKDYNTLKANTKELFLDAVKKRVPKAKIGILFSGGIDSTIIAKALQDLNVPFTCYTAGFKEDNTKEPDDVIAAKKVAKDLNLDLNVKYIQREKVTEYIKKIVPLIEDSNVVKVGVALPFYVACEQAKKDGVRVIFSGLGSEEIFAGYQRHKESSDINKECISGLRMMYERDLYRDDVVTMNNNIELRLPFLDKALVDYAVKIPSKYKIKDNKEKIILRDIAKEIGVPKYVCDRKKKAAQYGSRFDSAIKKLAGKKLKATYLNQFLNKPNRKLGVLFSSGKDSCYALHIMQKMNYEISCLITLKSKNQSSYMFHTPNINLAEMQAEAMQIPILLKETQGEKELELDDLKQALKEAKKKYQLDGIITGALYSTYQRDRIEKIADKLQLKVFNPLWHINQELEMRNLLDENFQVILSSIAAYGLNKDWLGKILNNKDVDKLVELKNKIGINVAGEGGEFESLVIDAPFFKKKIVIEESEILVEDENIANFIIKKAKLIEKAMFKKE